MVDELAKLSFTESPIEVASFPHFPLLLWVVDELDLLHSLISCGWNKHVHGFLHVVEEVLKRPSLRFEHRVNFNRWVECNIQTLLQLLALLLIHLFPCSVPESDNAALVATD